MHELKINFPRAYARSAKNWNTPMHPIAMPFFLFHSYTYFSQSAIGDSVVLELANNIQRELQLFYASLPHFFLLNILLSFFYLNYEIHACVQATYELLLKFEVNPVLRHDSQRGKLNLIKIHFFTRLLISYKTFNIISFDINSLFSLLSDDAVEKNSSEKLLNYYSVFYQEQK